MKVQRHGVPWALVKRLSAAAAVRSLSFENDEQADMGRSQQNPHEECGSKSRMAVGGRVQACRPLLAAAEGPPRLLMTCVRHGPQPVPPPTSQLQRS